jgi:hypothetical protein
MDKTRTFSTEIKHKQGFALMITLSVLAVVIGLTMILLSYFEEVQQDASSTEAMIQADVYYSDIRTVFTRFGNKQKALFSTLYKFPVSLRSPDGRFFMSLHCKALSSGININWLGMENKPKMREAFIFAQTIFDDLAQRYNLKETNILLDMLREEIGGKKKYIKKEYSRLRQKNGIISYEQFMKIVSWYQLEVDDLKVSHVPWSKYFSFSSTATKIDAEYSSPELISLLFDIDLQTVREWHSSLEKSSLQVFVAENGGVYAQRKNIIAGKSFLGESQCDVSYKSGGGQYKFRFKYILGEAKHFEFYGKH